MSRDSKDPQEHPVPRTLEALERLIEACKDIALIGALDEFEGADLHAITEAALALYDRFTDRELVDAFEANDAGDDPDIQGPKERVRQRLLRAFQESEDPALQEIALKSMPTDGEAH